MSSKNTYIQQFFSEEEEKRVQIIGKLQEDLDLDKPHTESMALEYS